MTEYSRLDDRSIEDVIIRAYLNKDVVTQSGNYSGGNIIHTIKIDEEYRPDLISFRVYNTPELRWVVSLIAGNEDETFPLPVGSDISLPTMVWIRERIRHYTETPELE